MIAPKKKHADDLGMETPGLRRDGPLAQIPKRRNGGSRWEIHGFSRWEMILGGF